MAFIYTNVILAVIFLVLGFVFLFVRRPFVNIIAGLGVLYVSFLLGFPTLILVIMSLGVFAISYSFLASRASAFLLVLVLVFFLIPAQASAYTIQGNTVYVNNAKVFFSATPHTQYGPGWVEFNLTSKQFTGDARIGILATDAVPKRLQFYDPHNEQGLMEYVCKGAVSVAGGSFSCVNASVSFSHSFAGNTTPKNFYWYETYITDWSASVLDVEKVNLGVPYDGYTKAYYITAPIVKNTKYKLRIYFNIPERASLQKYGIFAYDAAYNNDFAAADAAGRFLYLDPWTGGSYILYHDYPTDDAYGSMGGCAGTRTCRVGSPFNASNASFTNITRVSFYIKSSSGSTCTLRGGIMNGTSAPSVPQAWMSYVDIAGGSSTTQYLENFTLPSGGWAPGAKTSPTGIYWYVLDTSLCPTTGNYYTFSANESHTGQEVEYYRSAWAEIPNTGLAGLVWNGIFEVAVNVHNVNITPTPAYTHQKLTGQYTYTGDNPEGSSTYKWFKNGVAIANSDATYLLAGNTTKGDSIIFEVSPVDDESNSGDPVNSTALVISNTAPSVTGVAISPNPVYEFQQMKGTYTFADNDSDTNQSTYRWFLNGALIAGATLKVLYVGNYSSGDSVIFEVRPYDGTAYGTAVNSSARLVSNSLAYAYNVTINPAVNDTDFTVFCSYDFFHNDSDPDNSTYRWFEDKKVIAGQVNRTLSGAYLSFSAMVGDYMIFVSNDLICEVTPCDNVNCTAAVNSTDGGQLVFNQITEDSAIIDTTSLFSIIWISVGAFLLFGGVFLWAGIVFISWAILFYINIYISVIVIFIGLILLIKRR